MFPDRDIAFVTAPRHSLIAKAQGAGTVNGTGVDRGSHESCLLPVVATAATGSPSSLTVTVKLQHSDSQGSGYEDFGTETVTVDATSEAVAGKVGFNLSSAKKYIRAVATVAASGGSSPATDVSVPIILAWPDQLPAS